MKRTELISIILTTLGWIAGVGQIFIGTNIGKRLIDGQDNKE